MELFLQPSRRSWRKIRRLWAYFSPEVLLSGFADWGACGLRRCGRYDGFLCGKLIKLAFRTGLFIFRQLSSPAAQIQVH